MNHHNIIIPLGGSFCAGSHKYVPSLFLYSYLQNALETISDVLFFFVFKLIAWLFRAKPYSLALSCTYFSFFPAELNCCCSLPWIQWIEIHRSGLCKFPGCHPGHSCYLPLSYTSFKKIMDEIPANVNFFL